MLFSALKYPLNKCQPQDVIGHLIQIALGVIFQMQWLLSLFLRLSRMQMNRFFFVVVVVVFFFTLQVTVESGNEASGYSPLSLLLITER